jgi:hypothetical protein
MFTNQSEQSNNNTYSLNDINELKVTRRTISLHLLEKDHSYNIIRYRRVHTKFGHKIILTIGFSATEDVDVFLPERYKTLTDEYYNWLCDGTHKIKYSGLIDQIHHIKFE